MLPLSSVDLTDIHEDDLDMKWEYLEQFRLGGGTFADVFHVFYKGHDAVLKRPKTAELYSYPDEEREKVRREAEVVAALINCENVVRIYGTCAYYPFCGMVMEYCAGPNLSALVYELDYARVEIETYRIFKWCHDLTKTFCELNRTHYHGDIKAENVLVKERPCCCRNGKYKNVTFRDNTFLLCEICRGVHLEHLSLKICDFGMSYEHNTNRRYPGGTREFNAPETSEGTYTEKSEVYSFGHLMLQLIIGKPTDQCRDGQRRFLELYNNKRYDLTNCKSNSICETITWCLDKSPEKRPNFGQLLDKLNDRFVHYKSLRGDTDRRSAANIEREEFLEHCEIPRKIASAHRTITTSTFLSISTNLSISKGDLRKELYGGPFDNEVFVADSPLPSPQVKCEETYEMARNFVENHLYTGDEEKRIVLPPRRNKSVFRKNSVLKYLVQAKDRISEKIIKLVRR